LTRERVFGLLQTLSATTLATLFQDLDMAWSQLYVWCAQFLGLSFRERLMCVFANLGRRFGVQDSRGTLLTLELSHDELADMIASSRPMVSRLIAELFDQRHLRRAGKHYVLVEQTSAEPIAAVPTVSLSARDVNGNHGVGELAARVKQARSA